MTELEAIKVAVEYLRSRGYVVPPCGCERILDNARIVLEAEDAGGTKPETLEW
jgi:hypothetical protein